MDKYQAASTTVIAINKYNKGLIAEHELIKIVCNYFDRIKNSELKQSDLKFLKFISNIIGIPHYYDLLGSFQDISEINEISLNSLSASLIESTLYLNENTKVHKYQKQILEKFDNNKPNRYFLSASTSFGKTHLVYDIIDKMNYKNIALIFPTIALLSENLEKLLTDKKYSQLKEKFAVHTLSEISTEDIGENNILIYTPERFLSYTDKARILTKFDFIFIDEIYKLDNEYIIDNAVKENERDVAYRLATFQALKRTTDILLAGPYIEVLSSDDENYNESFDLFLCKNQISKIDYNKYEIVGKIHKKLDNEETDIIIDEELKIHISKPKDKNVKFVETTKAIVANNENCIVYCSGGASAENYAQKIIDSRILDEHSSIAYAIFLSHLRKNFDNNWIVYKALEKGIGIHHGLIPKFIQKEIINLFNNGHIKILLSTTTITEGVNTTAKNLIVLNHSKGRKILKPFDAKNISGRAGRFLKHYTGRVIIIDNDFEQIVKEKGDGIKHKNYDKNSIKDDIDLFFTENEYLSEKNITEKNEIEKKQKERNLPEALFEQFKAISRKDKITVYDEIKKLNSIDNASINKLISKINSPNILIDYDGLQVVIEVLLSVIKPGNKIYSLFFYKKYSDISKKYYSNFINLLHFYLKDGFMGAVKFKKKNNGDKINQAMRETADFVYNLLKYHAVKYLGVFNLMYKYIKANEEISKMEDVTGIDRLLSKLEYNALSSIGRKVSDYGVPTNVLTYFENYNKENDRSTELISFDDYEKGIVEKVKNLI